MSDVASALRAGTSAPRLNASLCTHALTTLAPCRRCVDACPVDAVSLPTTPVISDHCTGCGACVAACPMGALDGCPDSDDTMVAGLESAWLAAGIAVLACVGANAPEGAARLPCLARVTAPLLLGAVRRGAWRVVLIGGSCAGCTKGSAPASRDAAMVTARDVLRAAGRADVLIEDRVDVPVGLPPASRAPAAPRAPPVDRRGFFRVMKLGVGGAVGHAVTAVLGPKDDGGVVQARTSPPRARLLAVARALGVPGGGFPVHERAGFGSVQVGRACFGCQVCERVCPTGALKLLMEPGRYSLTFTAGDCVACGSCAAACMDQAIVVDVADRADLRERTVADVCGTPCPRCGRPVRTGGLCRLCGSGGRLRALGNARPTGS